MLGNNRRGTQIKGKSLRTIKLHRKFRSFGSDSAHVAPFHGSV